MENVDIYIYTHGRRPVSYYARVVGRARSYVSGACKQISAQAQKQTPASYIKIHWVWWAGFCGISGIFVSGSEDGRQIVQFKIHGATWKQKVE